MRSLPGTPLLPPLAVTAAFILVGPEAQEAGQSKPFFEFRGWETLTDGLWFDNGGTRTHWHRSKRYLDYLDTVLAEAPNHDANALILMGRGNHCEVHTFVEFREWPRLRAIYADRNRDDRKLQTRRRARCGSPRQHARQHRHVHRRRQTLPDGRLG